MARRLTPRRLMLRSLAASALLAFASQSNAAPGTCSAERSTVLLPTDPALCASLEEVIRKPSALLLGLYEPKLGEYLRNFCYRDSALGWKRDKRVRDTGPYIARLQDAKWTGTYYGRHSAVVIWYSKEMYAWLKVNRPPDGSAAPPAPAPVPDGAIMVKEMYPGPASACADVDPLRLMPTHGATVMIRDRQGAYDGWFWGMFGWSGWEPDWPPGPSNPYPKMGFGQWCMNCHASAEDNLTFASLRNVEGEPGEPLVYLSQDFFSAEPSMPHHRLVALPSDDAPRLGQPHFAYDRAITDAFKATNLPAPSWGTVAKMPSETYDKVWVSAGGPTVFNEFLTSDQCLGCHDAGSTGLQFEMTAPNPHGDNLLNLSPYGTWRTSPMGLGGRDPIFYAQLASEIDTFHPELPELIQDVCLGCHGILGQRQHSINRFQGTSECLPFLRKYANAVPWPDGNPSAQWATLGALARDGISCTACHHMVLGENDTAKYRDQRQNDCVAERQKLLNPGLSGFAKTFTGSFLVGPPDKLNGPFKDPKKKPMKHALGIEPAHYATLKNSEICGTCHTVHLPVFYRGKGIAYIYEQTTYPEWAFSAYRTGETPDGALPFGPGARAQSCQGCHMPSRDANGKPYRSKIAAIQEYSNFPESDYNLGPKDIDLPVREGFARHTLVGLNVFFVKMAQQFPDVLGIRTQDPMLVSKGLDPLLLTEQAMLDQASERTASIEVGEIKTEGGKLSATVTVTSKTGHKLPSGVGFRRAFLEFSVLDEDGDVLWASGRTDGAGRIVDQSGQPVAGEIWWNDDCSARLDPGARAHQPHYQFIERQDQAQIYQELVTAPPDVDAPQCGHDAKPEGELTTSFLSICADVKDNRILPHGFLNVDDRILIAQALGAGHDLAEDVGPTAVGNDPDYVDGGADSLVYSVDLAGLPGQAAAVQAALYYQATPPYFLQDRFCTSRSEDTQRLYFLAGHLNLNDTRAEDWKLRIVTTPAVPIP